jgi:hypothetical protein
MTLTVRSATVSGATTKGSALTHAELDENFNHLSQASNHTFTPSGTGPNTSLSVQAVLRSLGGTPQQKGAAADGTTDDSTAFTNVQTDHDFIYVPSGTYRADITISSSKVWYFDNVTINGYIDCSEAQNSKLDGFVKIIPQTGATFGMKWRKTRYCSFGQIQVGSALVIDTYDGIGFLVQGGTNAGSYYNTVEHMFVTGMKGQAADFVTDDGVAVASIAANKFGAMYLQYSSGGLRLKGAFNNTWDLLSIEQCTDTILNYTINDSTARSHGNVIQAFYSENPSLSTWISYESTSTVGNKVTLMNTADGTVPPANFLGSAGSQWNARAAHLFGASGMASYGAIIAYGATTDTVPRTQISGATITHSSGSAAADCTLGRQGAALWGTDDSTWLRAGNAAFNGAGLRLGTSRVWVNASTNPRYLSGSNPGSDGAGSTILLNKVSADKGNADGTLTVGTSEPTALWNTALTADRAVTLSTTNAANGDKFRIIRGASATGAFNLNVGTGPLKALGSASTWCDVEYNGSAWMLTASGSL